MELELRAELFATKAHTGQVRKNGVTPYISHPKAVVGLLKSIGVNDDNLLASGWLHDVIEDCGVTKKALEREFNLEVARIVSALTRDVDRRAYKNRIINADYSVQIVKLADVVHNCSDLKNGAFSRKTIERKLEDAKESYLALAQRICPTWYDLIQGYLHPHIGGGKNG